MANEGSKPAAESPSGSPEDIAYWQALGEFIETFSATESMLFTYLSIYAGLAHYSAKALLSGIHVDQIINYIRRMWYARPPDPEIALQLGAAMTQLALINNVRNNVVHFASTATFGEERISTNISRALKAEKVREYRVSARIIKSMVSDLNEITDCIIYALTVLIQPPTARDSLETQIVLSSSWQYKPPLDPDETRRK
jgi:hypothetical protein